MVYTLFCVIGTYVNGSSFCPLSGHMPLGIEESNLRVLSANKATAQPLSVSSQAGYALIPALCDNLCLLYLQRLYLKRRLVEI